MAILLVLNSCGHRIKSMNYNKLILVEHHFRSNDYDFNREVRFPKINIIEKRKQKIGNITLIIET